jgi:hypothetical protein
MTLSVTLDQLPITIADEPAVAILLPVSISCPHSNCSSNCDTCMLPGESRVLLAGHTRYTLADQLLFVPFVCAGA